MQTSRLLTISVLVTSITIMSILASLVANLLLDKSLSISSYYIIIILTIASLVLASFQIFPLFSKAAQKQRMRYEYRRNEREHPAFRDDLTKNSEQKYPIEFAIHNNIHIPTAQVGNSEQKYPIKVTLEVDGEQIIIGTSDLGKTEVLKFLQALETKQPSEAAKNTPQDGMKGNTFTTLDKSDVIDEET